MDSGIITIIVFIIFVVSVYIIVTETNLIVFIIIIISCIIVIKIINLFVIVNGFLTILKEKLVLFILLKLGDLRFFYLKKLFFRFFSETFFYKD